MRLRMLGTALVAIAVTGCGYGVLPGSGSGLAEIVSARQLDDVSIELTVDTCNAERREVRVAEGDDVVEVSVEVEGDTQDDCLDPDLEVRLDEPLGERALVDGATGDTVALDNG